METTPFAEAARALKKAQRLVVLWDFCEERAHGGSAAVGSGSTWGGGKHGFACMNGGGRRNQSLAPRQLAAYGSLFG